MRLSINKSKPLSLYCDVYLNDREVDHCIEADEEYGFCKVNLYDGEAPVIVDGRIATDILHGDVEIVIQDDAPPLVRKMYRDIRLAEMNV